MYGGLCFCQLLKDRQGARLDGLGKAATIDERADIEKGAMVMAVSRSCPVATSTSARVPVMPLRASRVNRNGKFCEAQAGKAAPADTLPALRGRPSRQGACRPRCPAKQS